jgi:hypothetical protein
MKQLRIFLVLAAAIAPLAGCVVAPVGPVVVHGPAPYAGAYWVPGHFGPYGYWHPGHWA